MKCVLSLVLLLFSAFAEAQPGISSKPYGVKLLLDQPLHSDTTLRFEVRDPHGHMLDQRFIQRSTRDSVLLFTLPPSASPGPWQVADRWSGRLMQLDLRPYESPLNMVVTLPFSPGAYNVDIQRLWKCFTDQAPGLDNETPWPTRTDTLACGGGRIVWSRGGGPWRSVSSICSRSRTARKELPQWPLARPVTPVV